LLDWVLADARDAAADFIGIVSASVRFTISSLSPLRQLCAVGRLQSDVNSVGDVLLIGPGLSGLVSGKILLANGLGFSNRLWREKQGAL
jgi:hypothetical protein